MGPVPALGGFRTREQHYAAKVQVDLRCEHPHRICLWLGCQGCKCKVPRLCVGGDVLIGGVEEVGAQPRWATHVRLAFSKQPPTTSNSPWLHPFFNPLDRPYPFSRPFD